MPTSPASSSESEHSPGQLSSAAELLAAKFPPLAAYWPNLNRVSAPQTAFLLLDQLEAIYGGAAGGGKSDALLAAALQYVDVPGYAALILRRTFKQLSLPGAIMSRSKEWLAAARNSREVHWNDDDKTWTFPSGATLTFGYLDTADDIYRYQGPEFQYVGFDELTQFQLEQYTYLFSRVRRRVDMPVPVRVRAASNPGGIGHAWVKQRFPIQVGDTPEAKGGRLFVPAKVSDNPGLDPAEYALSLGELNETLRQQLMDGDWGAFEGAAFTITADHLIRPFDMPEQFERFESMDYGLNNPTAWLAWAVDYEQNLIAFDEYYKPGLPSETAPVILAKRQDWRSQVCYGDPNSLAMRTGSQTRWGEPATVETLFADEGVYINRGNDNPRAGYAHLRELLKLDPERRFPIWHPRAGEPGAPRMFIVAQDCSELAAQLTAAPLQPNGKRNAGEMVDPEWEGRHGHAIAAARYGVLSRPDASKEPEPEPDPREDMARRALERASGSQRLTDV